MANASLAAVRRAALTATNAASRRDEAIREAQAQGETIRAIADAAGLSPARVHQIIHGR